ncbi:palmitoyl-acyl carrier protein thioesterase, chloroplastic-like [Mangifera indica]|uniref:palmitoyl-acyl carrier protein thioesterase, chloroplastic-like n=1 Tax=Mangifera indica TaxID=29780 RepID=UPI001CF9F815|nr:palmitoyl-acyl carrier protein thioesterase, chloroplastic-like [Mangifera indica]
MQLTIFSLKRPSVFLLFKPLAAHFLVPNFPHQQMAAFCPIVSYHVNCSCSGYKQQLRYGGSRRIGKVDLLGKTARVAGTSMASVFAEENYKTEVQVRQNIPTGKKFVDHHRQGRIVDEGVGYRQTIVIRSYEVGPDKTATLESLFNLFQETALNHVWMSGLLSNGFGATHGMMRNNLIWVVSRMQVQVDHYPVWGEVVEIDTWVGASGKNGMRRDWLIRSQATGHIFARATSTWVMMNEDTRRLSKMPEVVRAEISPWFIDKCAIKEDVPEKILKLDGNAKHVNSDLQPKRTDLDMNNHVNNVKYVRWMLETIPDQFQELSGIILEYRRECGGSDKVQALCQPDEDGVLKEGVKQDTGITLLNGFSLASEIINGAGLIGSFEKGSLTYTHLLQTENEEIVRGRTTWQKKLPPMLFST